MQNPCLDEDIQPLALTEGNIDDLVASLASSTSADYKDLGVRELARQRELSRTEPAAATRVGPLARSGSGQSRRAHDGSAPPRAPRWALFLAFYIVFAVVAIGMPVLIVVVSTNFSLRVLRALATALLPCTYWSELVKTWS